MRVIVFTVFEQKNKFLKNNSTKVRLQTAEKCYCDSKDEGCEGGSMASSVSRESVLVV